MSAQPRQSCDCDVKDLILAQQRGPNPHPLGISRFSETTGYVWCGKHRVMVAFTAPKEAWDRSSSQGEHGE